MVKRWIIYLATLLGLIIFYVAYQGWIAWALLMTVLGLPLFSLIMSLPFMLAVRPSVTCSGLLEMGQVEALTVNVQSVLLLPPARCRFLGTQTFTGVQYKLRPNAPLPTDHCGALVCRTPGYDVYDFLGLFRLRLRRLPTKRIIIRPHPMEWDRFDDLDRRLARAWRPKYGGGFSENHELRLYRPGDSLNQVHWKLSAKTGKLIIREPMVPQIGKVLLTLDLSGTPDELDRKLGRLLWMGRRLLARDLRWHLQALTGEGLLRYTVGNETDLMTALDELLCSTPVTAGTAAAEVGAATWHCHIGGALHEE